MKAMQVQIYLLESNIIVTDYAYWGLKWHIPLKYGSGRIHPIHLSHFRLFSAYHTFPS